MSEISVLGHNAPENTQPISSSTAQAEAPAEIIAPEIDCDNAKTKDSVEFSAKARWIEKIHQLPAVRQNRIDELKQAIASDEYMTDEKLQIAYECLIEEVTK